MNKHPRELLLDALREWGPQTGQELVKNTGLHEIGTAGVCAHMVILRRWGKVRAGGTTSRRIYELESE